MARAVYGNRNPSSPVSGFGPNPQSGAPMAGGTMGGRAQTASGRPGMRSVALGDEVYLWILVIIEVLLMGALRRNFRKHHGG